MTTRYDRKIARIRSGNYAKGDFIIADAKDADMSGGVRATGFKRDHNGETTGWRSRPDFLAAINRIVNDDVVDIMLMSAGNLEAATASGVFSASAVQLAFRANDTTDVWAGRHASYQASASRPFHSADLDRVARPDALALYSLTFNNDLEHDLRSLEAFRAFRREVASSGQRYFLEVFNPNVDCGIEPDDIGAYVNDCTVRLLAGLTAAERPEFLKVAYNGEDALRELSGYDPSLVIGLLGGGAGTSRDAFELIEQGERFGARLALFGRKINNAEDECAFIRNLRRVADRALSPEEAVRHYHEELLSNGIAADRKLADDLKISNKALQTASYG